AERTGTVARGAGPLPVPRIPGGGEHPRLLPRVQRPGRAAGASVPRRGRLHGNAHRPFPARRGPDAATARPGPRADRTVHRLPAKPTVPPDPALPPGCFT